MDPLYDFTSLTLVSGVGDFEEVYGRESNPDEPQHGLWDAVLTCFFIDTVGDVFSCGLMPFFFSILTDGDRRRILSTILESSTRFSLPEGFG